MGEKIDCIKAERFFFVEGSCISAYLCRNNITRIHEQEFYEIIVVAEGSGVHTILDRTFTLTSGDVLVIPPGIPHSTPESDNQLTYHLLATKELMQKHYEEGKKIPGFLTFIEIGPELKTVDGTNAYLHLSPAELLRFIDEMNDSTILRDRGYVETSPLNIHIFFKVLYRFSILLGEQISTKNKDNSKHTHLVIRIMEYIHANYDHKITLEMLCDLCYLSRSTLLRAFSDICGCSPLVYHSRYRANKARHLIKTSAYTKTQVAHMCGYCDLSHMERCLEKFSG